MNNPILPELMKTHKHANRILFDLIQSNRTLMLPNIGPKIISHQLANQTQMPLLKKVIIKFHDILMISEPGQNLILLLATPQHHLIVPYDFDSEHLALVFDFDDLSEHAFAEF